MKLNFFLILLFGILSNFQCAAQEKTTTTKLENKTLVIPMLGVSEDFKKYALKKGKTKDMEKVKSEIEKYNTAWKEGISQSVYDATPYEFSDALNMSELNSNKSEYLHLYFNLIKKRETLVVYSENKRIATISIIGFDLKNKDDVRRAMNILNSKVHEYLYSLNASTGKIDYNKRKEYRENVKADFLKSMKDKTLYVSKYTKADTKKYSRLNENITKSLKKNWNVSKYKVVSNEQLNDIIINGKDPNGYYIISQKKKPRNGLIFTVGLIYTYGLVPIIYYAVPHTDNTVLSTNNESIQLSYKSYSKKNGSRYKKLNKIMKKAKKV